MALARTRYMRDMPATLRLEAFDENGVAITGATAVTATVTDASGAALSGSPFTATEVNPTTDGGAYQCVIPAVAMSYLDTFDVLWSFTSSSQTQKRRGEFEIVGGFLFEIQDIRSFDTAFADTTLYPAAKIKKARDAAEDRLEQVTEPAFRPRGRRVTLDGTGAVELLLPDSSIIRVVSASVDDVALTSDELALIRVYDSGIITRDDQAGLTWSKGRRNVTVYYEHGMAAVPRPVHLAAMALAKEYLIPAGLFSRTIGESTEGGGFLRQTLAGRDGFTGIPEVDAVIDQFGRMTPTVA